jgi:hypothetical protein
MPSLDDWARAEAGEFILAGCLIPEQPAATWCSDCNAEFGVWERNFDDLGEDPDQFMSGVRPSAPDGGGSCCLAARRGTCWCVCAPRCDAGALADALHGGSAAQLSFKRRLHGWPGIYANELARPACLAARR